MDQTNIVDILESMASKICHDLISPIGAIANGIELLEELGADDDVTAMIAFSATQANAKLKAMRVAYGLGGSDEGLKTAEIHTIFEGLIAGEKRLFQDWDAQADLGITPRKGLAKTLLCALIFISEALPKGGVIRAQNDGADTILITGEGENAHFHNNHLSALNHDTPTENLDPKFVHAYLTGMFAQRYSFNLTANNAGDNFITLRLAPSSIS